MRRNRIAGSGGPISNSRLFPKPFRKHYHRSQSARIIRLPMRSRTVASGEVHGLNFRLHSRMFPQRTANRRKWHHGTIRRRKTVDSAAIHNGLRLRSRKLHRRRHPGTKLPRQTADSGVRPSPLLPSPKLHLVRNGLSIVPRKTGDSVVQLSLKLRSRKTKSRSRSSL